MQLALPELVQKRIDETRQRNILLLTTKVRTLELARRRLRDLRSSRGSPYKQQEAYRLVRALEREAASLRDGGEVKRIEQIFLPFVEAYTTAPPARQTGRVMRAVEQADRVDAAYRRVAVEARGNAQGAGSGLRGLVRYNEQALDKTEWQRQVAEEFMRYYSEQPLAVDTSAAATCKSCRGTLELLPNGMHLICAVCSRPHPYVDMSASNQGYSNGELHLPRMLQNRLTHFSEWMANLQWKEQTRVAPAVVHKVMVHLARVKRVRDPNAITLSLVYEALSELDLPKCYPHLTQITCVISGKEPVRMLPREERRMRDMFTMLQLPYYLKYKPDERRNFFSYPYCFAEFALILQMPYILPLIRMLKGTDKAREQDRIFEMCANDLGWPFRPLAPEMM